MNKLFSLVLFSIIIYSSISSANGQSATADTAFIQESVTAAVQAYRKAIGSHAHLYSGQEYVEYRRYLREGHQFYLTDEFSEGSILYEGIYYEQIPILYDIVRDEVVIRNRNNTVKQKLLPEKINYFRVHGHTFISISHDSLSALSNMKEGFYDLLFQDKIMLLAKRSKEVKEEPKSEKVWQVFKLRDLYYIWKDQQYYQVQRKRALYKVLKDRKNELQKFARTNRLDFREKKEESFLALVKHYSSLKE